jgi:hypothetical protein
MGCWLGQLRRRMTDPGRGVEIVAVGATRVRLLAVTAAACIVVMVVSCSSVATKSAGPSSSETPQKPDFTQVTTAMFVDRSAFPNSSAMEFKAPTISNDPQGTTDPVDPPECGPIYWGPPFSQQGFVEWSSMRSDGKSTNKEGRDIRLALALAAERPDLRALLGKCGTIRYQGVTYTVTPLHLPGLPSWADSSRINTPGVTAAGISGFYRGLLVAVFFTQLPGGDISPNDTDALVNLFNDQVTKLAAI